MAPPSPAFAADSDGDEDFLKADKKAARAARFNTVLVGNRYKEVSRVTETRCCDANAASWKLLAHRSARPSLSKG